MLKFEVKIKEDSGKNFTPCNQISKRGKRSNMATSTIYCKNYNRFRNLWEKLSSWLRPKLQLSAKALN